MGVVVEKLSIYRYCCGDLKLLLSLFDTVPRGIASHVSVAHSKYQ